MKIEDFKYLPIDQIIDHFGNMDPNTPVSANTVAGILHRLKYPLTPNPFEMIAINMTMAAKKEKPEHERPTEPGSR